MASFFENLFDFSDPARAARVRGGLIGAGQAISRPYGNIGSAMAGAAAGAEDARQNYAQQQYQELRMKAAQAELTKDERKRNALNELMRNFGKSQQPAQPAFTPAPQMQLGLAPGAPVQDENGAVIPQPMQASPNLEFEQGVKQTDWYKQYKQRYGEEPNLYAPEYNLEKAWKMGIRPTPDKYDGNFPHWPDKAPDGTMLKAPNHPTIWMQYFMDATGGKDPEALGIRDYESAKRYIGKDFVPPDVLQAQQQRQQGSGAAMQPSSAPQQQMGGLRLPEGYTPESFRALAAYDGDAAMKLLTAPPEIKTYRPGDRIYRNGVEIAAIPDSDTAPKTTGGMYWNEKTKTFQPIEGYEDQARRIAAAGRAPTAAGDGYRIMKPDEKKAAGLPTDGTYQVSRTGKIERVAGNNATRQVPSMALAGMTANRNTLRKIDEAIAMLKTPEGKQSVGYQYGFSDAANQRLDPGGVGLRALISDIGSQKLHDRSGASVTISEAPRLQPFVPSVRDRDDALITKLENLKAEYQANVDEADSFYSPEAGYMRLPEQRTAPPPPAPKTPPPAAIQQLKMMGQKGAAQFDAIFGKGAAAKYLGKK